MIKIQLTHEEMRILGYRVVNMIIDHIESLCTLPLSRKADRPTLERQLREPPPEEGIDVIDVLQQLRQVVFLNTIPLDHPRFFAFVPGPSNFVGAMADALSAGFNVFGGTWLLAPGPTEVELVTIDWLRQLCGLPDTAGGLYVSGGSIANLTALAVARSVKLADMLQGAVVYCSDQTHTIVDRALKVLGFAPEQQRRLPSDEHFRLSLTTLQQVVAQDRAAGKKPFCVVANASTTNTGAVDPLPALADFCRANDLWLHVDAAYGGGALLCEQGRFLLQGLERVDSLTLDPHKWLFQPYEMGCVLVRDRRWLRETFHISAEYLHEVEGMEEEVNFRDYGLQLTRSTRAIKLWMSLKVFGLAAFRQAVAHGFRLAKVAEEQLRQSECWEVVTPAQMGIVTFRFHLKQETAAQEDAFHLRLIEALSQDGFAFLCSTTLRGRVVLRMCTINPRTSEEDIRETIRLLERLAKELCA